ncbi:hypothetical protein BPTFM16_00093 [Altererythrobacter insulae]|nr:hypothetical protein BPTFM16_00093 [Altererythrobacter insulae]
MLCQCGPVNDGYHMRMVKAGTFKRAEKTYRPTVSTASLSFDISIQLGEFAPIRFKNAE